MPKQHKPREFVVHKQRHNEADVLASHEGSRQRQGVVALRVQPQFIEIDDPLAILEEALQRIVVALSNPASSFLLFTVIYYSNQEYGWRDTNEYTKFAYFILWIVSLFWGIIGLLPIFPYPGGRAVLEVLSIASPRNGLMATLVISIVVALAYIAYTVAVYFGALNGSPLAAMA